MAGLLLPKARVPEKTIQAQVVEYAQRTGWTVWEMFTGSARGGTVFCTKGIPDLFVFRPGMALWMELKAEDGRVRPAQYERHTELTRAKVPILVCWSFDEARKDLDEGRRRALKKVRSDMEVQP